VQHEADPICDRGTTGRSIGNRPVDSPEEA
jgi:hypothetical protein